MVYTVKQFCNFYNLMIGRSFKIPICNFYKHVSLNCVKFCKNKKYVLVEITNWYFKTASNHIIVKVTKFFYSVLKITRPNIPLRTQKIRRVTFERCALVHFTILFKQRRKVYAKQRFAAKKE